MMESNLRSTEEMTSMNTISIALEEDLTALLQGLNQPVQQAAREFIVLELYRRGTLSSGKAHPITHNSQLIVI